MDHDIGIAVRRAFDEEGRLGLQRMNRIRVALAASWLAIALWFSIEGLSGWRTQAPWVFAYFVLALTFLVLGNMSFVRRIAPYGVALIDLPTVTLALLATTTVLRAGPTSDLGSASAIAGAGAGVYLMLTAFGMMTLDPRALVVIAAASVLGELLLLRANGFTSGGMVASEPLLIITGAAACISMIGRVRDLASRIAHESAARLQSDLVVHRSFGPAIAERILENRGVLAPRRYDAMTVFFSDIEGFTTISEALDAEDMVSILNEYLARVTNLLRQQHGGEIAQYIGDAVMAYWGAPLAASDGPRQACLAAIEAQRVIDAYGHELESRGMPPLGTRIGVRTGPAVAGLVGHPDRQSFAALGDTVNTAARFESANKIYGTRIIVGPETMAGARDAVFARELDLVRVKGKTTALRVYEVLGLASEPLHREREVTRRYEAALALFREREFEAARRDFETLARDYDDGPSRRLRECCDAFLRSPPPEDWDGANELHDK